MMYDMNRRSCSSATAGATGVLHVQIGGPGPRAKDDIMQTPEVRTLIQVDKRFTQGRWTRGRRIRHSLDFCLMGAVDDAVAGFAPEVKTRVLQELVHGLPAPLRLLGEWAPRTALIFYNDWVGRRRGTLRLVKTTLARVSTTQPFTAQRTVPSGARPWRPLTGPNGVDSLPLPGGARPEQEA